MDLNPQSPFARSRPHVDRAAQCCLLILLLSGVAAYGQIDTNDLPALAPPYGEMPASFWERHEAAIIIACLVLFLVVLIYCRVRRRPATPALLPPEIKARQALSACLSKPEDGKLLSEVSRILRRYVAAAFALPAGEVTTAEFCAQLAANDAAGAELTGSLTRFLRECDERKFSPLPSVAPLNAVVRSLDLIALAEARRLAIVRELEARKTPVTA